jgi:hypothetical protein
MQYFLSALVFMTLTALGLGAQEAVLQELSGRVEVKLPGSAEWVPAEPGIMIEPAALISTGFKSTALLALGNSTLLIQPLTRLSLEEILARQGKEEVSMYLRTGRVRAEVRPPSGGTVDCLRRVHTPAACGGTKGMYPESNTLPMKKTTPSLPPGRKPPNALPRHYPPVRKRELFLTRVPPPPFPRAI